MPGLFEQDGPPGFRYREAFITDDEEAARLLEECDWIPACMRTPDIEGVVSAGVANDDDTGELPAFLADDGEGGDDAAAIAAAWTPQLRFLFLVAIDLPLLMPATPRDA